MTTADVVQFVLPIEPLSTEPVPVGLSLQERFELFHDKNPWVYDALEQLTRDWLGQGHKRIGIGMLTEVLRWQYARQTTGDDEFKLNNNYRSRYVRLLITNHPEWADAFHTRKLRAA